MNWIFIFLIILHCEYIAVNSQDRVPPGVHPQHYQQHPNQHVPNMHQNPQYQMPNQYQAPHQHQAPQHQAPQHQAPQQQVPQQQIPQQQIPQQQIPQQQVPVQQVPINQQMPQNPPIQNVPHVPNAHQPINQQVPVAHNHGHHQPQILNKANMAEEKEHIAEHLGVQMDTSKMSEQELQFHYFKMHDADNNNKLDGCELIKSLIHWHEEGHKDGTNKEGKIFTDEELINLIDPILEMDDTNKDGFIDYPEFIQAQQKAASTMAHQ